MKYFLIFLGIFIFACEGVYERGNGNISSEERLLDSFSEVEINGQFQVELVPGRSEEIRILTDENLHKYIEADVRGDRLVISTSERISSDEAIKIFITYDEIDELRMRGACVVTSDEVLEAGDLLIELEGAGIVELEIDAKELDLVLSGAGLVELSGKVRRQRIDLGGAGNLSAYDLRSREAEINLSGFGGAQVNVSERLYGKVTGAGSIKYKGNPEKIETDISGVGNIKPAREDEESDLDIDI